MSKEFFVAVSSVTGHPILAGKFEIATQALEYRLRMATFADAAIAKSTLEEIEPCERQR